MLHRIGAAIALATLGFASLTVDVSAQTPNAPLVLDDAHWKALAWRDVGPARGGRVAAVAGVPQQRDTYYFGACGGGVWKTTDGGHRWQNVSDGFFGGSIGAVAVSEWDPNVVYAGGGEKTVRGNVSHGDGIWRSTDAGRTWTHVGLRASHHVSRLRIHPRDPEHVLAAVMGKLYGPSEERGVYRTRDGGQSWERVLFVSPEAGCVDLEVDPTNARILYASFWRVRRTPWSLSSGGEGSGLWKSTDGGDTWQPLHRMPGFPAGPLGIIGIAVSPSDAQNLYASVEASEGGIFRSRDGGATWQKTNGDRKLRQRAWYYSRLEADPKDAEALWVLNVEFHRSEDGGKTFRSVSTPHGDNHDLWIDPLDPLRMIESNDGGANVTLDGGRTWTEQASQPTAQIYRVSTDDAFPYRLLGGQQDNSALRIRSRSAFGGSIGLRDWEPTAGGESGFVVAHPGESDLVFGGSYGGVLVSFDHRTGERRSVDVWPDEPMGAGAADLRYRFQWNYPICFSPHAPHALYAAANVLFRSADRGASWTALSGDLTRNDKSKQEASGGPITKDNTSVEYHGTIFAALESPRERGVLWTGSDDGLVHVSRDDGKTWTNVTPPELPEWAQVNSLEPHPTTAGGLYVAATCYKLDDFAPYLFRTLDYGASWTRIDAGIDRAHFTRVVRADPVRAGMLFAGTEIGIYLSLDDGASWQRFQLGLPLVPITDLALKDGDLVAATQGRGFWILDDLSALRAAEAAVLQKPLHLFAPRPALRTIAGGGGRGSRGTGANPPSGAVLRYWLSAELADAKDLALEIRDERDTLIRRYTRKPDTAAKPPAEREEGAEDLALLPAAAGLSSFAWDLEWPGAEKPSGIVLWNGDLSGPRALPGRYRAKLTAGEHASEASFEVQRDPRSTATLEEMTAGFEFQRDLLARLARIHRELKAVRDVRKQVEALEKRLGSEIPPRLKDATKALLDKMRAAEETLHQTKSESSQDPLNFPVRLNDKLAKLAELVRGSDRAPTAQALAVRDELGAQAEAAVARLQALWLEDLAALNALVVELGVPAFRIPPAKKE